MAEDDEIDILGDFTFNSCFAQNSQGIPTCSDREDTVHPQWLLDSTATNWYDSRKKEGPLRKLSGTRAGSTKAQTGTTWTKTEHDLLLIGMNKYGRNIKKISQTLKSKSEAEIQAMIEAEFGVYLDIQAVEIIKEEIHSDVPLVEHEEIISDDVPVADASILVQTGSPTVKIPQKKQYRNKNSNNKSLLKPSSNILTGINPAEILYEDDMVVGSIESVGSENNMNSNSNRVKAKDKTNVNVKLGNHRRKVPRSDKVGKNSNKDNTKSPQGRQRKNSSISESESLKSPKLQIVLGSGQALPVAEGEQVIKIEKKDSDSESDIDIDTNSDIESDDKKKEATLVKNALKTSPVTDEPVAVPLRKFEPMPKRHKKFNLDGDGGYTIMHTSAGDLYTLGTEPRKERPHKKPPVQLIPCRFYSEQKPAPCRVLLNVSTLLAMEAHAHSSRAEVMGLVGGHHHDNHGDVTLTLAVYRPAAAAASGIHCDMDPVSQLQAAQSVAAAGAVVAGWHHSHPTFPAAPSSQDLSSQDQLQRALDRHRAPFMAIISSQHPHHHYRCIRVETESSELVGYQVKVRLVADISSSEVSTLLEELGRLLRPEPTDNYTVNLKDICPYAKLTYLDKFLSSVSHHMGTAGYADDDIVLTQLIQGIRDVFR